MGMAGGMVGAALIAVVLGGLGFYKWKHMGEFLPLVLEFNTDQKSKFHAYGYLSCRRGCKVAKLTIPPFALSTAGPTSSAASIPILGGLIPISFMPLNDSEVKSVKLYSKDTAHTITGKANLTKDGIVNIMADAASGTGEAWGLAHEVSFEYPVSA